MSTKAPTYTILALAAVFLVLTGVLASRQHPPAAAAVQVRPLVQTEMLEAALEPGDTLVYELTVTAGRSVLVLTGVTSGIAKRWHLR